MRYELRMRLQLEPPAMTFEVELVTKFIEQANRIKLSALRVRSREAWAASKEKTSGAASLCIAVQKIIRGALDEDELTYIHVARVTMLVGDDQVTVRFPDE